MPSRLAGQPCFGSTVEQIWRRRCGGVGSARWLYGTPQRAGVRIYRTSGQKRILISETDRPVMKYEEMEKQLRKQTVRNFLDSETYTPTEKIGDKFCLICRVLNHNPVQPRHQSQRLQGQQVCVLYFSYVTHPNQVRLLYKPLVRRRNKE